MSVLPYRGLYSCLWSLVSRPLAPMCRSGGSRILCVGRRQIHLFRVSEWVMVLLTMRARRDSSWARLLEYTGYLLVSINCHGILVVARDEKSSVSWRHAESSSTLDRSSTWYDSARSMHVSLLRVSSGHNSRDRGYMARPLNWNTLLDCLERESLPIYWQRVHPSRVRSACQVILGSTYQQHS